MATRQRPPRGRLRLSPTPPLTHGGNNEPPREMATTSRPEQNPRLAGREMDENVLGLVMATRQRPPRGRLRLSPTPPLTHGGNNEPPREMATTSRPEQNPRLAGREMDENVVGGKSYCNQ
ncbi:hypothetical protein RRG08_001186 [Elysia crispata]|uniref:Uncharacterized protein n=1 Tax=Elysia crispata TaxID=231223 RepID=A0AAE1AEF8_9GAST|nr:hypothetical protein RRG08_001186 [Elysia crispata]